MIDLSNMTEDELKQYRLGWVAQTNQHINNAQRAYVNKLADVDQQYVNHIADIQYEFQVEDKRIFYFLEQREHFVCEARKHNSWELPIDPTSSEATL